MLTTFLTLWNRNSMTLCISSVTQLCLTLCDPMNCSMPDFPVYYQVLELAQTHVHRFNDAIQPSHPLSSPSLPAFNHSQKQGFFQSVSSSHQVVKVLELQLQHQSFQWIFRTDFLRMDWFDLFAIQGILKSLLQHRSPKASVLQFQLSLLSNSHIHTWLLVKP